MKTRSLSAIVAAVASISLAATACSSPTNEDDTDDGGSANEGGHGPLSVGWNQPFYSYNSNTANGNNVTNSNVAYLTTGWFNYYDAEANLLQDETYGTYEKVSDDPLTVKYTFADDNEWSDGTPTDAVDMLLRWAAGSGQFNTIPPGEVQRDETSAAPTNTQGEVFFDSADYTPGQGLALVTEMPEISEDRKSITLKYDKPWVDWELDLTNAGTVLPAHVVAQQALGIEDAQEAKDAVVQAIEDKDKAGLAKISSFWNTGFDFADMPSDESLVLSNSAFVITNMQKDQFVTLSRNENYSGMKAPNFDEITIRFNEDPTAQLQALQNGEISMMYPQVTEDVVKGAEAAGLEVIAGIDGTYEHIDLTFDNGGPFDPATYGGDAEKALKVRQAFLHAVPRQEVVDKLIKPITPDAEVRNSILTTAGSPGYDEVVENNGSGEYSEADPAESKRLLAEAGVTTPIDVRMLYAEGNSRRESEFQLYRPALAAAGFNLIDGGDAEWSSNLGNGSYDATFFGWQSTNASLMNSAATWVTDGGNNYQGYSNPQVDKLLDEYGFTTDEDRKQELAVEIDRLIWEDAATITIFQFPAATIYDSGAVTNLDPAILSPTMFYGFWDWEKPGA